MALLRHHNLVLAKFLGNSVETVNHFTECVRIGGKLMFLCGKIYHTELIMMTSDVDDSLNNCSNSLRCLHLLSNGLYIQRHH